eukprot:CFRG6438T1
MEKISHILCGHEQNAVVIRREGVGYIIRTAIFTLLWWACSVTIIISNKYILTNLGFQFPFFITTIANTVILCGSYISTRFPVFSPEPVTWNQYIFLLAPAGALTSIQIGLDSLSLVFLSVSVHVIFQSITPLVQLGAGILIGIERWRKVTATALAGAFFGVALSLYGESEGGGGKGVNVWGTVTVLLSLLTSVLRSIMQQAMVQGAQDSGMSETERGAYVLKARFAKLTKTRLSPLTVLLYKSPTCVLISGLISLIFERKGVINFDVTNVSLTELIGFLQYAVLKFTSALSLSILGVMKNAVFTIGAASVVFGERLEPLSWFGFLIILASVLVFQRARMQEIREKRTNNFICSDHLALDEFGIVENVNDEDIRREEDLMLPQGGPSQSPKRI